MKRNNTLNQSAKDFLVDFQRSVQVGKQFSSKELEEAFIQSPYFLEKFHNYIPAAIRKSIWNAAVNYNDYWIMVRRGLYEKVGDSNQDESVTPTHTETHVKVNESIHEYFHSIGRNEYITFLSKNLSNVLNLKSQIEDPGLKHYHLSSKGIGDDLYFLTESYYKQLGRKSHKHWISDYITSEAKRIRDSNESKANKLKYEHMVPKNIYISKIKGALNKGELSTATLYQILHHYYIVCTVTTEEDDFLPSTKMPEDWDEIDPFYRYSVAGVTYQVNN